MVPGVELRSRPSGKGADRVHFFLLTQVLRPLAPDGLLGPQKRWLASGFASDTPLQGVLIDHNTCKDQGSCDVDAQQGSIAYLGPIW